MTPRLFKTLALLAMLFGLAPLGGASAGEGDTGLERLNTWGRVRGWEGVGILRVDDYATCTATLIAPDLVLTAAHCLFDRQGKPVAVQRLEFRAGWRDGKAVAVRRGRAALVHPDYVGGGALSAEQVRSDLGLIQLADPILSTHADPFQSDGGVRAGDSVSVVSYGRGRNDAPSRQRSCQVLEAADGIVAMSCDVVPGSSGAPVFSMKSGRPRIVAVVSALGQTAKGKLSFGMDIGAPLARLMRDFRAGRGVYPQAAPVAKRLTVGQAQSGAGNSTGARFLKP